MSGRVCQLTEPTGFECIFKLGKSMPKASTAASEARCQPLSKFSTNFTGVPAKLFELRLPSAGGREELQSDHQLCGHPLQ